MNSTSQKSQRILALDILRGITIAGMLLVNNPGSWSKIYAPLGHAAWNGLTPTDLVFPFFMFIMGISMYIALKKFDFKPNKNLIFKICKRTLLLYIVGLAIAWLSLTWRTYNNLDNEGFSFFQRLGTAMWNFDRIRILGVIPRLAITYGLGSLLIIFIRHRFIPWLIALILIGYSALLIFGNGYAYDTSNILSIIDIKMLGLNHMYNDNGIDPEGLLSTIPALAHVLLGFYIGKIMMQTKDIHQKIEKLFIIGAILTFSGFLLSYGLPINKKIWSPTFVLVTIGLGSTLLALLIWIIDVKDKKRWTLFFQAYGVNPLFMYVLGTVLSIVIGNIILQTSEGTISLKGYLYSSIFQPYFGEYFGSLVFAVLFIIINWIPGYYLLKKKIYIKL